MISFGGMSNISEENLKKSFEQNQIIDMFSSDEENEKNESFTKI